MSKFVRTVTVDDDHEAEVIVKINGVKLPIRVRIAAPGEQVEDQKAVVVALDYAAPDRHGNTTKWKTTNSFDILGKETIVAWRAEE